MTTATIPDPRCAVGTGAEHRPHAFTYDDDGETITVTCAGFTEPSDDSEVDRPA